VERKKMSILRWVLLGVILLMMYVSHTSRSQECEDCSDNGTDSEADCFSTISLEDDAVQGEEEEGLEMEINGTTLSEIVEDGSLDDVNEDVDPANHLKPPKERSIAHSAFSDGSAVFLLLDIEIGGEHAGIIQLSSEIVSMKLCPGRGISQDQVEEVEGVATLTAMSNLSVTFGTRDIWH
jgi:hypothetical protein